MNYIYYRDPLGNFGDDLNPWIWDRLFYELKDKDIPFYGIGSILGADNPLYINAPQERKIVFGTGVRPSIYYKTFSLDKSWNVRFLRGPLSAFLLGNEFRSIVDGAYSLRLLDEFENIRNRPKKYKISLMPYFKSLDLFNWEKVCESIGCHYISPRSEKGVSHTMHEIASSELLITEAMHGAIVADAFRVPWHRFVLSTPITEREMVSSFKWLDWLMSINLNQISSTNINLFSNSKVIKILNRVSKKTIINYINILEVQNQVCNIVSKYDNLDFYLSADDILKKADDQINQEIEMLKKEIL